MSADVVLHPHLPAIRSQFPTLKDDFAYLENAGGSQVPKCVADAMHDYMLTHYVQLGAPYPDSDACTEVVTRAHDTMATWMNATPAGGVILGPSSTALINLVAQAYGEILRPGDEVVICETNHEANAGGWQKLERLGIVVRTWKVDPESFQCSLEDLDRLIGPRTKVVAFPHVSNLLGEIMDVPAITRLVHSRGARVFVDGVAYAPHGLIDVAAWGVDWYIFSNYKVYGPHMATLFGRHDALAELTGPNHGFIPKAAIPGKWELGALNHEGCAGINALMEYASFLAAGQAGRAAVEGACRAMAALEQPLAARLIAGLEALPGLRIVGPGSRGPAVGTVSFVVDGVPSTKIPPFLAARGVGIRAGHMYAMRLCLALGLDPEEGVVRISLLHYNSLSEIDRAVEGVGEAIRTLCGT